MKILLTRHGQTDWNVQRRIQGKTDIELNNIGIMQAEETRKKLLNYNIDYIISSPLKRAKKTAEIIGKDRNIPIIFDERIEERAFGEFEGKTSKEMDFSLLWNRKVNKKFEKAESVEEVFNRVNNFLENLKKEYPDKTVLLVTHGGISVPIRAYFEGIPEDMEVLDGFGLDNCEVKQYEL